MSERDYSEDNCSDTPYNWNPPMPFEGFEKHVLVLGAGHSKGKRIPLPHLLRIARVVALDNVFWQ